MQVTYTNGNKEVTTTITGQSAWEKEGISRIYFDLSSTGKRTPISKLYEVLAGDTKDHVIDAAGRTFAFEYGIDCDSKTKRAAAKEAAQALVNQIVA